MGSRIVNPASSSWYGGPDNVRSELDLSSEYNAVADDTRLSAVREIRALVAIQFSGVSCGYCNSGGSARAHTHSSASLMTTSSGT